MYQRDPIAGLLARAANVPFRLWSGRRPAPPRKALILQPCCVGAVMLTTPLLAALSEAFPTARFDWAVSDWALPAISSNRRITRLIRTGAGDLSRNSREDTRRLFEAIRREKYDTCFIPDSSGPGARLAWRAGIRQRVGLDMTGRGFTNSIMVRPDDGETQAALAFLALASAVGVDEAVTRSVEMEFEPPDQDRATVTRRLVEDLNFLGDRPLVIMHPGGGENPSGVNLDKRWPVERFARLANYIIRNYRAHIVLTGTGAEQALVSQVAGMIAHPTTNLAGETGLGELGALCELADLYVGNDAGSTYVAAATGCPTLAIYGPTDPAVYSPYMITGRVVVLRRPFSGEFSWAEGVSVEDAAAAVDDLLSA